MTSNRLKLYDTIIKVNIDKKSKDKLRSIAFKNKLTLSEYVRQLIAFTLSCYDLNNVDSNNKEASKLIEKFMHSLEVK